MEGSNIMSYQKCPICNGTGDNPFVLELPRSTWPCPTCKGTRIISELTGLPPVVEENHNIFEPVDPYRTIINSTQNSTQDGSNIQSRESQV